MHEVMPDDKFSKIEKTKKNGGSPLSWSDFFDSTKPWDLRDHLPDDKVRKFFEFVPERFREGPWKPIPTWTMFFIISLVISFTAYANIKIYSFNGDYEMTKTFVGDEPYPAFTMKWFCNATLFFWMLYVCWAVYRDSSYSFRPWVTFTIWSWTIMCIRHGLCALAPFLPSIRLLTGILRFPVLLSSSVTFQIWNFLLLPAMSLGFFKGQRRNKFLRWAFNWRLCQIHIFNIFLAYLNCIWAEPRKKALHLGDYNAAIVYIMTYIFFYFSILDRIGVHLYPVFSPRTLISIPCWLMAVGVMVGNSVFWNKFLSR